MRIAIVAESFLPAINGVTNSILRVIEHMTARGHEVTVIAPSPGVTAYGKARIIRVPSFGFPRYPELRIGHSRDFVREVLREIKPDVVPFVFDKYQLSDQTVSEQMVLVNSDRFFVVRF